MNYPVLEKLILSTPAASQFNGVVTPGTKTLLANGYYVVFLNPSNQKIGHYTGLYIKDKKAWFFNSLGYHNGYMQVKNLLKAILQRIISLLSKASYRKFAVNMLSISLIK
jgi:hypothetical protein